MQMPTNSSIVSVSMKALDALSLNISVIAATIDSFTGRPLIIDTLETFMIRLLFFCLLLVDGPT